MIDLRVLVDCQFIDLCRAGSYRELNDGVARFCRDNGLDAFTTPFELIDLQDPVSEATCATLRATASHLVASTDRSIAHIRNILPLFMPPFRHKLVVTLLPFGRYNFGPREGLQILSLNPKADPEEAYLFMVHVYYHEVTHLFYTDKCARCSAAQNNVGDLLYWVKLLIRNEGIANYVVLDELKNFTSRNPAYSFCYFGYARQIGNEELVKRGLHLLNTIFEALRVGKLDLHGLSIVQALKNKLVSIINLVGIHMASAIADRFGPNALRDVYKKDADEFFRRYSETDSLPLGVLADLGRRNRLMLDRH